MADLTTPSRQADGPGSTAPTQTPTNTVTPSETPTNTPTPTITQTPTNTITPTTTQTPTPTTPGLQAYLFIDSNNVTIRNALNSWMLSQGSSFRGFNINAPSTTQVTFNTQMNSYISYSGWGVSEPSIITAPISTTSGGNDSFGNPIVAYKFQTTQVLSTVVPSGTFAWYTWLVSTGATNGQKYSTIKQGVSSGSMPDRTMSTTYNSLIINYTGSTNIPAGTYIMYTTYNLTDFRVDNGGSNYYYQGGTLI